MGVSEGWISYFSKDLLLGVRMIDCEGLDVWVIWSDSHIILIEFLFVNVLIELLTPIVD